MLYAFSAFLAYFVKGLCGFANTLVFSSILSFWQDNIYITPIDLPLSLISNLLLVFHDHKALSVKIWGSGAFFMILGIIPGTFFLKAGDPALIKIILGFLTMGLALQMLLKKKSAGGAGSALSHALIAILAGFISGLLGIGALISIYMARVTNSLEAFRGNLSLLFIMTNLFRFAIYIRTGILTAETFNISLTLVPFMLAGLLGGTMLSSRLGGTLVRRVIFFFLLLSGVALVVTNLHI